jgi:hypothetical protein
MVVQCGSESFSFEGKGFLRAHKIPFAFGIKCFPRSMLFYAENGSVAENKICKGEDYEKKKTLNLADGCFEFFASF